MTSHRLPLALLASCALLSLAAASAAAKSWCAYPLIAHEWGVHVYSGDGRPVPPVDLPAHFHRATPSAPAAAAPAVRDLPADSGVRALPVVHFYAPRLRGQSVPLGLEVGFTHGAAAVWFPAVDLRRSASEAQSPAAAAARAVLLEARARRAPFAPPGPALPADPTRQLVWDRLDLTPEPSFAPPATATPWVTAARALGALWVNGAAESERFVFYEAPTREPLPLALRRGPTWGPGRRHLVLDNRGAHAVHDLLFVHREGGRAYVFFAPQIPAGASAGFLLEEHAAADPRAATTGRLRDLLTDAASPAPPRDYAWDRDDCVMGRDPAQPVEHASGHRLFAGEVDLLLAAWGARMFEAQGTTVVYREDPAALDAAMPLSVYTDMFHFVTLRRAGLAVWEHVTLP